MTVNTRVIKLLLTRTDLSYVQITPGLRLQVIPDIEALPFCQKHQSAAFVASKQLLIVWEDDPKKLLERASYIQDTLMKMIWGTALAEGPEGEKKGAIIDIEALDAIEEAPGVPEKSRRIVLTQAVLSAATLILVIAAMGSGWRQIAIEIVVDRNWVRIAFAACIVPQIWLSLVSTHALQSTSLTLVVLFPSSHWQRCSAYWTYRADGREYKVLFRKVTSPSSPR